MFTSTTSKYHRSLHFPATHCVAIVVLISVSELLNQEHLPSIKNTEHQIDGESILDLHRFYWCLAPFLLVKVTFTKFAIILVKKVRSVRHPNKSTLPEKQCK